MIVCSCYAVSDRTLDKLIDEGARSLPEIRRACGAGGDCGSCQRQIQKMIDKREEPAICLLPILQTG